MVWEVAAPTLQEARSRLNESLPRHVTLAKARLVVVGEEAARTSLPEVLDFLTRTYRLPVLDRLLVARGTAAEVLSARLAMDRTVDEEIEGLVKRGLLIQAGTWDADVVTVVRGLTGTAHAAPAGAIQTLPGGAGLRVAGTALLARGRLAGWLDEGQTRGLLFVLSRVRRTSLSLPCPGEPGRIAVETRNERGRIAPRLQEGRPAATIRVEVSAVLADQSCTGDFSRPEGSRRVAATLAAAVRSEVAAALRAAQAADADVFGFARSFRIRYPRAWQGGLEARWAEEFPRLPVTIDVRARILATGITAGPLPVR